VLRLREEERNEFRSTRRGDAPSAAAAGCRRIAKGSDRKTTSVPCVARPLFGTGVRKGNGGQIENLSANSVNSCSFRWWPEAPSPIGCIRQKPSYPITTSCPAGRTYQRRQAAGLGGWGLCAAAGTALRLFRPTSSPARIPRLEFGWIPWRNLTQSGAQRTGSGAPVTASVRSVVRFVRISRSNSCPPLERDRVCLPFDNAWLRPNHARLD
jgi:hypothetical protein